MSEVTHCSLQSWCRLYGLKSPCQRRALGVCPLCWAERQLTISGLSPRSTEARPGRARGPVRAKMTRKKF